MEVSVQKSFGMIGFTSDDFEKIVMPNFENIVELEDVKIKAEVLRVTEGTRGISVILGIHAMDNSDSYEHLYGKISEYMKELEILIQSAYSNKQNSIIN